MLTPDDAELLARDPGLEGAWRLLDPEAATALVREAAHPSLARELRVTVDYLRYKPSTSLVAGLRLDCFDGVRWAYAVAGSRGHAGKLTKHVTSDVRGLDGFAPRVTGDLVLVAPVRADPRLKTALRVMSRPFLVVDHGEASEVLRYRPHRRLVVRVDGAAGPLAVVRGYPGPAARTMLAACRSLSGAGLPVPRRLALRRGGRLVVFEHLPGVAASDGTDPALLAAAGALLARVQAVAPHRRLTELDCARLAQGSLGAVQALVPDGLALAEAVVRCSLDRLAAAQDGAPVTAHGDFSADQLLVHGDRVSLLDLDRAAADGPAGDPASWFAAEAVAGRWDAGADPRDVLAPLLDSLLGSGKGQQAARTRRNVDETLGARTALALLARVAEPFRVRAPGTAWAGRCHGLVEAAARQVGLA
ncbi:hypothetical protein [Terrabacter sp. MAHUQ-38]|jgi:hypothetical protein|uniref:hypothetical protein n=1 Tax=unclassified Terrabacter TaxID=2630222 RepID=UPI00165D3EAF|nr:hypothetical protein [Terrabacter sp. MAHUQ-38]MBC9824109.1 hypothetical protein [Terrabacter sp. MAHUQ-38]